MNYSIQSNELHLANGHTLTFEHPIKKVVDIDTVIIVIVKAKSGTIYNNNVFAFSRSGDFLWRIGNVELYDYATESCPYNGAIVNDDQELVLFNWCDTAVIVDPQTGDVVRTYQTK
jgi:hypothetical protein